MKTTDSSRRKFLQQAGLAGLAIPVAGVPFAQAGGIASGKSAVHVRGRPDEKRSVKGDIALFSKVLQWAELNQMADMVAECGFDGLDLTVRPGGHVEPARAREDLPKYAEAMAKVGKRIVMITTVIGDADDPYTEDILSTAAKLGIHYYRTKWYRYDKGRSIDDNIDACIERLSGLARINEAHDIKAAYQNHAGIRVGSAVWDLAFILGRINSPWVGSQYDIRHAVVEGAHSWPLGFEYLSPHINTIVLKDFLWGKKDGKWRPLNVPLGDGMVDFEAYSEMMKALPADIAATVHMEYDLGGAERGSRDVSIDPGILVNAMKKDLAFVKRILGR